MLKSIIRTFGTVCLVLAMTGPCLADVLHVPTLEYPTISAAITAAISANRTGDTIVLASCPLDPDEKPIPYTGPGFTNIDFQGGQFTIESASGNPSDCIIDGQGIYSGFEFLSAGDNGSVVSGIKFIDMKAGNEGGGAIRVGNTIDTINITVQNCVFSNNKADGGSNLGQGGAVYLLKSNSTFIGCVFADNDAYGDIGGQGGAAYSQEGSPYFQSCVFTSNGNLISPLNGGAIFAFLGGANLENCTFSGNEATSGGAVYYKEGGATILNSVLVHNSADGAGGAVTLENSYVFCTNLTVAGNTASTGAGASIDSTSYGFIENSIFWFNESGNGIDDPLGSLTYDHSNIQGGIQSGSGNISEDPRFVDLANGIVRLLTGSPCIDAGDNNLYVIARGSSTLTTDIDGTPRILNGTIDIGAYEYVSALELTEGVKKRIDDFVGSGSILPKYGKPLKVFVNRAVARIHANDFFGAIGVLNEFISEVETLLAENRILQTEADELISSALYIIALLN